MNEPTPPPGSKPPAAPGLLHFQKPFEGGHAQSRHLDAGVRRENAPGPVIAVARGLFSLFAGMWLTLKEFFKPSVTLQYPRQALKMTPRFRGHIELVRDPESGKALCYACKLCERSCPTDCISVEGVKLEGDKRKSVSQFTLDFTKCSLCGSCVEACKSGAIRYSKEYNLASLRQEDYVIDLFKRLEAEARTVPAPAVAAGPAPAPAAGEGKP